MNLLAIDHALFITLGIQKQQVILEGFWHVRSSVPYFMKTNRLSLCCFTSANAARKNGV